MMIGQKRPFDPNAAKYMPQPDFGAAPAMSVPALGADNLPTFTKPEGHNWIGILADALSGLSGNGPIYAPMAERRRQEQTAFERGEQIYQRRRTDAQADDTRNYQQQLGLLDYKRAHPDDELTRSLDQAGITDPAQRQSYYRQDVERRVAPPMMSAQGFDAQGNPQMTFFPRAMPRTPPPPAVGEVRRGFKFKGGNPADPSSWEATGGAGSGPRTFP